MISTELYREEQRGIIRWALVCRRFTEPSLRLLYRHLQITSQLDAKRMIAGGVVGNHRTVTVYFGMADEVVWCDEFEAIIVRCCSEIEELELLNLREVPSQLFLQISLPSRHFIFRAPGFEYLQCLRHRNEESRTHVPFHRFYPCSDATKPRVSPPVPSFEPHPYRP